MHGTYKDYNNLGREREVEGLFGKGVDKGPRVTNISSS
jgi:hypothetical protein